MRLDGSPPADGAPGTPAHTICRPRSSDSRPAGGDSLLFGFLLSSLYQRLAQVIDCFRLGERHDGIAGLELRVAVGDQDLIIAPDTDDQGRCRQMQVPYAQPDGGHARRKLQLEQFGMGEMGQRYALSPVF